MVCSVAEGEDKPLKYPLMFRACELAVVNKIDLLEHVDVDLDTLLAQPAERCTRGSSTSSRAPARGRAWTAFRDWLLEPAHAPRASGVTDTRAARCSRAAERRRAAGGAFFGAEAERIARLCHRMAERFARGGRLIAFGADPVARSDARHVAVEFVHPGDRGQARAARAGAVPPREVRSLRQVELLVEPRGHRAGVWRAPRDGGGAAPRARARLPDARRLARGRRVGARAHAGAGIRSSHRSSSRRSITCCGSSCTCSSSTAACSRDAPSARCTTAARRASSTRSWGSRRTTSSRSSPTCAPRCSRRPRRSAALRAQTLDEAEQELREAARALRARFERGGRVLALGNGGSATDAMDAVADLRCPPAGWPAAGGDRPDRGPGHPHGDRQRRGRGVDLLASGHRPWSRR